MSKFSALSIEADKPSRMTLVHPVSRVPLGEGDNVAYIDLYSFESDVARKHNRAVSVKRLSQRGRKPTPEELEEATVSFIVALTAGWKLKDLDGNDLDVPFTQEDAKELYSNTSTAWVREQVDEFIFDRANFMKPSSSS